MKSILPVDDIVKMLHELNPKGVPKCRWNSENKERVYANIERWKKANPEKVRNQKRPSEIVRRARSRGAAGSFTTQEWDNLIKTFNYSCAYCKKKTKHLTVDHILPLSKGGSNYIDNIVPSCLKCNCSKNNKLWDAQPSLAV